MPYTVVCHHHSNGTISRAPEEWDDREDAAQHVCDKVEELAKRPPGASSRDRILLLRTASAAAALGYFLLEPVVTWAVIEIDRPGQPITGFMDRPATPQ